MDYKISASLACASPLSMITDIEKLERSGVDAYHMDFCDGVFAPTFLLNAAMVKALRSITKKRLDVHIYGHYPSKYLEDLKESGADVVIVHIEAQGDDYCQMVKEIRKIGMLPGIAVLPTTPFPADLGRILPDIAVVVANTVGPAYSGQPFSEIGLANMKRIRDLSASMGLTLEIVADGSVSIPRLPLFLEAGANHFVLGTASLFMDDKLQENAHKFRKHLDELVNGCDRN